MKVIILGGGASGLMAALSAARDARNTVTILERQSRVGRKLLATGNGRCNLTNLQLSPARYHGQNPAFAQAALTRFGVQDTLEFFRGLGLLTVAEDSGRVYPLSDQANSVLDVLVQAADAVSAARPGARKETLDAYIKRLEKLEEIANSYKGVERTYAIQAGREVRVMVEPEVVDEAATTVLAHDIAHRIENEMQYPGQVKVVVIRESRAVGVAK